MQNLKICEINVQTGEEILRDFNDEELKIAERDKKIKGQADLEAQAKREAALIKLAALGLTSDDLKALGLA